MSEFDYNRISPRIQIKPHDEVSYRPVELAVYNNHFMKAKMKAIDYKQQPDTRKVKIVQKSRINEVYSRQAKTRQKPIQDDFMPVVGKSLVFSTGGKSKSRRNSSNLSDSAFSKHILSPVNRFSRDSRTQNKDLEEVRKSTKNRDGILTPTDIANWSPGHATEMFSQQDESQKIVFEK